VTCADRKDLLLLYAFDQLEPDEAASLVAHLQGGCPRCTGELAAARAIAGHMALAVPAASPPPRVKAGSFNSAETSRLPTNPPAPVTRTRIRPLPQQSCL